MNHNEKMMERYFERGWSIAKIQTEYSFSAAYIERLVQQENAKGRMRTHSLRAEIPLDHRFITVGSNLRIQREIKGLSIHAAAYDLKISVRMLIKYEEGLGDIPVSFLMRASDLYNIQMKEFLNA